MFVSLSLAMGNNGISFMVHAMNMVVDRPTSPVRHPVPRPASGVINPRQCIVLAVLKRRTPAIKVWS